MSTYAIGDIHGCQAELSVLVQNLKCNAGLRSDDTLVFVGDYVDRGLDSKGVIDYLIHLSEYQKCVFLMGNHEDMMLWYLGVSHGRERITLSSTEKGAYWLPNGGKTTMSSYGIEDIIGFHRSHGDDSRARLAEIVGETHLNWLRNLDYYHIEGSHLFVHAGVGWRAYDRKTPEEAMEWSTDEDLLWDREAYHHPLKFGTMIYGHTPSKQGVRWGVREDGSYYSVGIDVGTVFGANPLTAVRIDDWKEFQ